MRKILLLLVLYFVAGSAFAQLRMRDVFASLPDSVLPLMTQNNRLDCIDFIENAMEARVKNRFDEYVILDSLTRDYLLLRTSESSVVEMKLLAGEQDSLLCVNRTYCGPAMDSEVRVYDMSWRLLRIVPRPVVEDFMKQSADIIPRTEETADTIRMIRGEAQALPLLKASLSSVPGMVCWTLQTTEFCRDIKKVADRYLQPVCVKP